MRVPEVLDMLITAKCEPEPGDVSVSIALLTGLPSGYWTVHISLHHSHQKLASNNCYSKTEGKLLGRNDHSE